jgi:ribosomal protein S18 acetylase RimI-like enzyme
MSLSNFERMLQLADQVFAVKNDPDQLDVNQEVMERLNSMHECALSEYDNGEGPVAWILIIPTTLTLMNRFLKKEISEKQLFELTPLNVPYEALYLCSALVLEEFRRKGIAKELTLSAIAAIQKDHPITALFVWPFSDEGNIGANIVAANMGLPLYKREE